MFPSEQTIPCPMYKVQQLTSVQPTILNARNLIILLTMNLNRRWRTNLLSGLSIITYRVEMCNRLVEMCHRLYSMNLHRCRLFQLVSVSGRSTNNQKRTQCFQCDLHVDIAVQICLASKHTLDPSCILGGVIGPRITPSARTAWLRLISTQIYSWIWWIIF